MKACLLVGSPRLGKSASEALGADLLARLGTRGVETGKYYVYRARRTEERMGALVAAVAQADLVILAAPLYVDCLPAPVIPLLETLAERLDAYARPEGQRFVAIANAGFPEAHHNDLALAIYRQFARQTGLTWAGGMALGAGEPLKGKPLVESGGMARKAIAAFDLAAKALAQGDAVPQAAIDLLAEPTMPAWLYRLAGGLGWWLQARPHGAQWKLRKRVWER